MEYSIKELSKLAGVSTRTLRYYDQIDLLKPSRITEAGYRYYGKKELTVLQQILFYRERGFELKTIQQIIYDDHFDMLTAMEEHLQELEKQKASTESLIQTVKNTIRHMKGEYKMKDKEMFQSLKEKRLQENEQKYGAEAREKYGNEQVDASNRRLKNLSAEQWDRYVFLEEDILKRLENGVKNNISADSTDAEEIVKLHKEWLCFTLPNYAPQVHRGIAAMYVADERFTKYYDRNIEGCAKLLNEAVQQWV
ncbi:MAG: MerR family transcriptional regulator [Lachnospiraceae bacterium]|nr:MerR family transcriptional regulator [Lachnospiraceae bacterium]